MTRWALVADVWYLTPRAKREDQTAVEFSNEVKAEISKKAGLRNLSMDGYYKVPYILFIIRILLQQRKSKFVSDKILKYGMVRY